MGEKTSIMSLSMKDSMPRPWLNSDPSGEISLSYMDTHGGLLYFFLKLFFLEYSDLLGILLNKTKLI